MGTVEICVANYSRNSQRQLEEKNEMPKGNCVAECIANLTKIYRGNGIFDAVNLKRIFLNSVSGDREMGDIVSGAVDICINESETEIICFRLKTLFFTLHFSSEYHKRNVQKCRQHEANICR